MSCFKCGQDVVGNAVYGLHNQCFLDWFSLDSPAEFRDLDPKSSSTDALAAEITKKKDTFFHGRYEKYSARLGSTEYILKVQEDKFPGLPATEFLCNQIAEVLGINVPSYHLILFENRITFVTRNFMQDHVGTLHHIYKFLPEGTQNHNCEEIAACILKRTGTFADVARFIEICLFDAFVGNNDRHGRNLGIIETAKGSTLAPMYDNPSMLGTQESMLGAHFNPSGSVWTSESKEPKPLDYISEFNRMGHEKIVSQFCGKIVSRFPKVIERISKSVIEEKRKKAFLKLLGERVQEFEIG